MSKVIIIGGGVGWDWSKVRAMGGSIDGHKNADGGIIPFLKITNDIAVAVDQLGTRKGAIAVYIEPWHMDINDFIDLRKNSGEESRRMQDMMKMYGMGGMDPNMFGGQETLVLNANHPLVKYLAENKDSDKAPVICEQLYDLAMLSHKQLSPDEMTKFVQRSNEVLMMLTK